MVEDNNIPQRAVKIKIKYFSLKLNLTKLYFFSTKTKFILILSRFIINIIFYCGLHHLVYQLSIITVALLR